MSNKIEAKEIRKIVLSNNLETTQISFFKKDKKEILKI